MRAVRSLWLCLLIAALPAQAAAAEEGLARGFLNIRVLEDRLLDALRIEALAAGRDPGSLYPGAGPIALAVVPVDRLHVREALAMLPLICEATVRRDPDRWARYAEMRLLNSRGRHGYLLTALPASCAHLQAGDDLSALMPGDRPLVGDWDAWYPWALATPVDAVGYGGYLGM